MREGGFAGRREGGSWLESGIWDPPLKVVGWVGCGGVVPGLSLRKISSELQV